MVCGLGLEKPWTGNGVAGKAFPYGRAKVSTDPFCGQGIQLMLKRLWAYAGKPLMAGFSA